MKHRGNVEREYNSAENLVTADEDIRALLAKSDAEFSGLGIQGTFFK